MTNIKEKFPEFFQKDLEVEDLKNSFNQIIVLDTNFLLDIIRMPTKIAKKYLETLETVKDYIYVPYLVALEFNFNKSQIKKEKHIKVRNYKNSIRKAVNDLKDIIDDHELMAIKESKKEFSSDLILEVDAFQEKILDMVDDEISASFTKKEDYIYNKLIDLIGNKIGDKYQQKWIDEIQLEGKERYENRIPPGFNDADKDDKLRKYDDLVYDQKFGDLIIWKDIIEYAKNWGNRKTKVIWVTDDGSSSKKSDLLYKVNGLTVGPDVRLMNELRLNAEKKLYILPNLRFVQLISGLTDTEVKSLSASKYSDSDNEYDYKYIDDSMYQHSIFSNSKDSETTNPYRMISFLELVDEYEDRLLNNDSLKNQTGFQDGREAKTNRIKIYRNEHEIDQIEDEILRRIKIGPGYRQNLYYNRLLNTRIGKILKDTDFETN